MIGDHHMRELKPGAKIRVEFNAEVIGLSVVF